MILPAASPGLPAQSRLAEPELLPSTLPRFAHAAFKAQENFTHSLLADVKGDVARAYGTWNEDVGAAERLTVVVDREGKVAHMQKNAIPDQRDHSAIEGAISAIA